MAEVTIAPATLDHCREVAENLRPADCEEALALGHRGDVLPALERGLERPAWTGLVDGRAACVFGVWSASLLSDVGVPWLVGTPLVERHAVAFLRRNRPFIADARRRFRRLSNVVAESNTLSRRWLVWLGFTMGEPEPVGASGELFRVFTMEGR